MAIKTKMVKKAISGKDLKGYAPPPSKNVVINVPSQAEIDVFDNIQRGLSDVEAMKAAGYQLSDSAAVVVAEKIKVKFNDRMRNAYDSIGLTPEFMAGVHREIMMEGRDGDKLKAIDQVLNIQAGYAPKQVEVNHTTFEQAVVEIGKIVNVHQLRASDVKRMFSDEPSEIAQIADNSGEVHVKNG